MPRACENAVSPAPECLAPHIFHQVRASICAGSHGSLVCRTVELQSKTVVPGRVHAAAANHREDGRITQLQNGVICAAMYR
jgi:hypothetical protein